MSSKIRDLYWPLLALLIAGGLAAPTCPEPQSHQLTRLGEIEASPTTQNAFYEGDHLHWDQTPCTFMWCRVQEI